MLDVFHKGTNLPVVSRQKNKIVVKSTFLTEITIVCTIRETYLTYSLQDETVAFSAIVRRRLLVIITILLVPIVVRSNAKQIRLQ